MQTEDHVPGHFGPCVCRKETGLPEAQSRRSTTRDCTALVAEFGKWSEGFRGLDPRGRCLGCEHGSGSSRIKRVCLRVRGPGAGEGRQQLQSTPTSDCDLPCTRLQSDIKNDLSRTLRPARQLQEPRSQLASVIQNARHYAEDYHPSDHRTGGARPGDGRVCCELSSELPDRRSSHTQDFQGSGLWQRNIDEPRRHLQ